MRSSALALIVVAIALTAPAENSSPSVSPDGKRIAFISDRDGTSDIYVMAADSSHVVRVTNTAEKEWPVQWSSDGSVLFGVADKDSSRLFEAKKTVTQIGTVPGRAVRFSDDGRRVLYALGTWTEVQLMESDLDGSHARQLTDGKSVVWSPRWSPNGRRIAFTGRDANQHLHIYLMNADGTDLHQLTHLEAEGNAQSPAWSRDGRRIAIQVSKNKSAHIWIVDAQSGSGRKLASHDEVFLDETPSWFPNGKRLAFQSTRSGAMEIWTMNADGTKVRQVRSSWRAATAGERRVGLDANGRQ